MSKKYSTNNFHFDMEDEETTRQYRGKKEKRQRTITKAKKKFEKRRENKNYEY